MPLQKIGCHRLNRAVGDLETFPVGLLRSQEPESGVETFKSAQAWDWDTLNRFPLTGTIVIWK
ncbi:MAG: hypothetical protein AB7T38_00890 [Nitrospirales bacterium]